MIRPASQVASTLSVERGMAAALERAPLALIDWGVPAAAAVDALHIGVRAPLLAAPPVGAIESWTAGAAVVRGRSGAVDHASDGRWMFGRVRIDEAEAGGIEAAARRAYDAIFASIAGSDYRYLQRTWNYIGDINVDLDGLERYRRFNVGRQDAFLAADYPAFDGAPAACGLGVPAGPLCVHFLAAATPPVPIENPRQVSAYRYPTRYGPRAPTFSRGAIAEHDDAKLLFISGTASIVGHESVHLGDVAAQTREAIANLRAVIERANAHAMGGGFALDQGLCTVYVRHPDDLAIVRAEFEAAIGAQSRASTQAVWLQADVCRSELLVEIEATIASDERAG